MKFTIKKERQNGTGISSYIIEPDLYLCKLRCYIHAGARERGRPQPLFFTGGGGGGSNFIHFLYKVLGKSTGQKGPF